MDVFTILLLLCISVIVILLDGYAIHRFLSPLDRQKSKAGYLCLAMLTLLLSQIFLFFPVVDVIRNTGSHDCGDVDSSCASSGMLPFWEYTFDGLLFFVSVLLPCVLFLYDQSASSVFSSACTRFLALCTVAIAAAGATCLLAATYFFLEKVSSFVFAFSGVFTLLSWLLFLVYVPYGLVRLPWTFLSAFIARVRKRSDAQYTQRVQQAEAFREELKRALPAELQVAEKLAALQRDFGREQRKLALRVKVNRQIRKVSQVLQRVVKEKEEQWGLVCRVEAEKLQRAGEASFIVWSLLLFVGFLLSTLLSLTVLCQTLLYSIPLVLAGKPLVSALTAWLVSIQDRGVALILLL
ncbi:hypothetical protein WA556_005453, partial [Blastocystis sp. ATCC 50177/Nand II]